MRNKRSPRNLNIFKRLINIPTILGWALGVSIFSSILVFASALTPPSLTGYSFCMAVGIVAIAFALRMGALAIHAMFMERMRQWLEWKFNDWYEVEDWVEKTSASDLEFICGFNDDKWIPRPEGGYEILVDDK